MARKYKRLRWEDRQAMETMLRAGMSMAEIAKVLGVHKDTIYKELYRSGTDRDTYSAEAGQRAI